MPARARVGRRRPDRGWGAPLASVRPRGPGGDRLDLLLVAPRAREIVKSATDARRPRECR